MNTKAIIDFSTYPAKELAAPAQTIHDKMTSNAATFTAPPVAMGDLQTLIDTYSQMAANRASRAADDVLKFNLARHALEAALHDLGVYVNLLAKGDLAIVEPSGFPYYSTGPGAAPGPSRIPAAPRHLLLRHGDLSTTIIARCTPDRIHSFNVAQLCTGDPNVEANWATVMQFGGGKVTIGGLTVGATVWVRIATVGPGAQLGAWSDPAKIVVT